jgi:hypothetical protein
LDCFDFEGRRVGLVVDGRRVGLVADGRRVGLAVGGRVVGSIISSVKNVILGSGQPQTVLNTT